MSAWMEIDARELGVRVLDFYATSLERGLAARAACDPARFVDVTHDEIAGDPLAVVLRIYARFGRPLEPPVREAIEDYARAHPKGEHGEHAYRLEDYGLTAERVRERFGAYAVRYGARGDPA
jgi:hypothetical protein